LYIIWFSKKTLALKKKTNLSIIFYYNNAIFLYQKPNGRFKTRKNGYFNLKENTYDNRNAWSQIKLYVNDSILKPPRAVKLLKSYLVVLALKSKEKIKNCFISTALKLP
jgi:hypothetical protein